MPKSSKFLKLFLPVLLVVIAAFICIRNYTPGTFLLGWDSVNSEFNFPLNIQRMFSHVWATEYGVGAISAHSDMSDLPRIIIQWLTSLILPVSFIRYFLVFTCLILGPLGAFYFLKYVFEREKSTAWVYLASFLGGLFYLLNLGTVQNFYVPLEMFAIAFAGLPWLALLGFKYLREGRRKNLLLFSLVVILIAPMAYASTQAYVIYLGLFLFLTSYAILSGGKKLKLKRLLILGIVSLLLNLYWVLPSAYSALQQSQTISNANINKLFSQESFLRNADYGDFKDVLIQRSFLFSWRNFDFVKNSFNDLMANWNSYLSVPGVLTVGYLLAAITLVGVLISVLKRNIIGLSFILPLLLSLFFLFNINPPLGNYYQYLYSHFSIFSEAFRTPSTKFSVLFEFILSFYFAYFCFQLFNLKAKYFTFFKFLVLAWLTGAIFIFNLPVFYGEMIGVNTRVALPSEYQRLFNWFDEHSEGRVALMPINTKFGWEYRNWGYEGSGFLTYGIKNPILYRDFDRWNSNNEDFFNQASFALYADDQESFVNTLQKYQVKYLLLDESIINAGSGDENLKIPRIKDIVSRDNMPVVAKFGFLTVFDTGINIEEVGMPQEYSAINANTNYSPIDTLYETGRSYIKGSGQTYPFVSLDSRSGVEMSVGEQNIKFTNISFNASLSFPVTAAVVADLSTNHGFDEAFNCDIKKIGSVSKEIVSEGIKYKASGGGASCDYISFPDLKYSQAYVLHMTGENIEGRSLKIYLFDSASQTPMVEEILPVGNFDKTYFVYPRNLDGSGYILNFETRSFGRLPSENLLTDIEFYPVDYLQLSEYKTGDVSENIIHNSLQVKAVLNYGTWGYKVDTVDRGLLELGQGFEDGWIAFQLQDNKIKLLDHTIVNSWANAWMVEEDGTVYIIFWPQLLEWGGIFILFVTLGFLLPRRVDRRGK